MKCFALVFLIIAMVCTASADTLFLNDGGEIKGKIINETPSGVTVEYFATATIKDQKTVSRADIARIEKLAEDQKAYQDLGPMVTPPTVLDTSFYDELTGRKIPEFIAKYPNSSYDGELRERLKTLNQEKQRVLNGDRRIDSVWITASEIASDPYQNESRIFFIRMSTPAVSADPVEYLRSYEKLEKLYPGSRVMPAAIDGALSQLDRLQSQIAVAKVNGEISMKNLSNAISAARPDEAKQINEAVDRDTAVIRSAMRAASDNGTKFFPVYQGNKELIDALQSLVVAEKTRLAQLKKIPMAEGLAASAECRRMLAQGNLKEAQVQFELSQKIWPANFENEKLKHQLEQTVKAETERLKAQASVTPSPSQNLIKERSEMIETLKK